MPRIALPVTTIVRAGVTQPLQAMADLTNGHTFVNDGRTFLEIQSTDASPRTVTFEAAFTQDDLPLEDLTVTIPAMGTKLFGPFSKTTFNQTGNLVNVNPSVGTTLLFRTYKL